MKAPIPYKLAVRTSRFFWRNNLAPTLCAAMLTGIFVCSLCLSESLVSSMKSQVNSRLGRIESCLPAPTVFRTQLANDIAIGQKAVNDKNHNIKPPAILAAALKFNAALISHVNQTDDFKTQPIGDTRSCVLWGVDEKFSHLESPGKPEFLDPKPGEATVSQYAAKLWDLKIGDGLVLTVERPQEIPQDSPFAKRVGTMTQLPVTVKNIVPDNTIASLNLKASQHPAVNVFVSLKWLQEKMGLEDRANIILSDSAITYNYHPVLDDYGFQFKASDLDFWVVSSNRLAFSEQERAALMNRIDALYPNKRVELANVMTTLVNKATVVKKELKKEDRPYISYSFLAATDDARVPLVKRGNVAVTQLAATDLELAEGDTLEMEFYAPDVNGELILKKRTLTVSRILEDDPLYYERSWVPFIKGVSDKNSIHNWDIAFPINNRIIRPEDEEYWDLYGSVPKFYINLDEAKELFANSAGTITSVRVWGLASPNSSDLAPAPQEVGWTFIPLKDTLSLSSIGAYDFALFFVCISLTIVFFSLALTVLYMRLNVNYRCKDIGLLQTVGWNVTHIRQSFIYENMIISSIGALLGIGVGIVLTAFAVFYLNYFGLGIIGVPFVGVSLNVLDLIPGALVGWLITFIATIISIRNLDKVRSIHRLQGIFDFQPPFVPGSKSGFASVLLQMIFWLILFGAALVPMTWNLESMKLLPRIIFFAASVALAFGIWSYYYKLKRVPSSTFASDFCNYIRHPRRSFFIMATGAVMLFLIPSLSLFMYRTDRNDFITVRDNGGYRLIVKTALPVIGNIDLPTDREEIGFTAEHQEILKGVVIDQALLRDGDDASLNNLYYPCVPRIIGVSSRMMNNPLFAWKNAMVPSFPWDALWRKEYAFPMVQKEIIKQEFQTEDPDVIAIKTKEAMLTRVMPFIIDVQTMKNRYHLKGLDSRLLLDNRPGREVQGRVVAIMDNDMFHGSLVTSDENVRRFFPEIRGCRMFFVDCPAEKTQQVRQALMEGLETYGPEIESVFESQNRQMDVHNAWIRLTQVWLLVGLGLGCLCYSPILRRSLLSSQSELANLYSMGFSVSQIRRIAILELIRPLSHGINIGTIAAIAATVGATLTFKNSSLLAWTGGVWLTAAAGSLIISWLASSHAAKSVTNESMSKTLKRKA